MDIFNKKIQLQLIYLNLVNDAIFWHVQAMEIKRKLNLGDNKAHYEEFKQGLLSAKQDREALLEQARKYKDML